MRKPAAFRALSIEEYERLPLAEKLRYVSAAFESSNSVLGAASAKVRGTAPEVSPPERQPRQRATRAPRRRRGFTLVELMVVVAIIAILAAAAFPVFQDYSVRAKMSEVILAVSACRTSISEGYQKGGTPPGANSWGCESGVSSKYVQKIETDADGAVTATITGIGTAVDGSVLTMVPLKDTSTPATAPADMGLSLYGWSCGGTGTTVDVKYLPSSCRG